MGRVLLRNPRRSARALLPLVAAAVLFATPGVACAEGPGYDGRADALVLKWQGEQPSADAPAALEVFGRGFRGGSEVSLRVGAQTEQTALADATGAVRLLVDSGAQAGTTISAVGQ